ncbi:MAG: ABC transporter ATP-binding protein, partial [Geitlerinemataceae cyanobacterium]
CTSVGIMELGYLVESTSLSELYQRLSCQYVHLTTLGNPDRLIAELKLHSAAKEWEILPQTSTSGSPTQTVRVRFEGQLEDRANLLRDLISAGISLTEFHNTQEDLESIFLKLGHQQVS